jgi:hypothetical protein
MPEALEDLSDMMDVPSVVLIWREGRGELKASKIKNKTESLMLNHFWSEIVADTVYVFIRDY